MHLLVSLLRNSCVTWSSCSPCEHVARSSHRFVSSRSLRNFCSEVIKEDADYSPVFVRRSDNLTVSDPKICGRSVVVCSDFVSEEEEQTLLSEIEPALKRLRYQIEHWDDAIHGYRETEKADWNADNLQIIQRIKEFAFPQGVPTLKLVHVLDLSQDGYIKPHVDSVRFCGNTVAGLSLLTDSVMRFTCSANDSLKIDVLLPRRSLYVMRDKMRYDFTHEILNNNDSFFKGEKIFKSRRISVICRNEPLAADV